VAVGIENAVDHRAQAVIEGIAIHEVNEADVCTARAIALFRDGAPQVILAHYSDPAPKPGADFCRDGAFTGVGITTKCD
jgi:hypothetical protein